MCIMLFFTNPNAEFTLSFVYDSNSHLGDFSGTAKLHKKSVELNWSKSNGALSYDIYRSINNSEFKILAQDVKGTTYSDAAIIDKFTHQYRIIARNGAISKTISAPIKIHVQIPILATGKPGNISLSHNNWSNLSAFNIRFDIHWGNNGTSWKLYEDGGTAPIHTGTLIDNSPNAQSAEYAITGKAPGVYKYKIEVTNSFGMTTSNEMTVTVK